MSEALASPIDFDLMQVRFKRVSEAYQILQDEVVRWVKLECSKVGKEHRQLVYVPLA